MGDLHQYFPTKTEEPKPSHNLEHHIHSNQRTWDELVRQSPLNRLRFYDAQLARGIDVDRDRVAELVREVGPTAVLSDRDVIGLIRQLWGEKAVEKLRARAKTEQVQR
jgi:chromosome condensin MukBEF MukE localization factor